MFAQWRLTLRQAEDAVRADRLEEALELARRPEVAEYRQANQLRQRIALELVERARDHLRQGHSQAAWHDLHFAELAGAPNCKVSPVRCELLERGATEADAALQAAAPARALAILDALRARNVDSPELRRLAQAAHDWTMATRAVKLGEFGRAQELFDAVRRTLGPRQPLDDHIADCQSARQRAADLKSQLRGALAAQDWPEVLRAAESLLEIAPDCLEVKQTRNEALRRLGVPLTQSPRRPAEEPWATRSPKRQRFILWVDQVAGFLVCQGNVVTLGQATPGSTVDIPILGDLSREHATIVRDAEGYLVRSARDLWINGHPTRQATLHNRDVIRLGRSVELRIRMPSPVSGTARLDLVSGHRLPLALAGILLMADTCVLGSGDRTHIEVPKSGGQVVLYRQGDGLACRTDGAIEVDGRVESGRATLQWSSRVICGDLSFTLEPLGSPLSQV